jgi:hypothetical protein
MKCKGDKCLCHLSGHCDVLGGGVFREYTLQCDCCKWLTGAVGRRQAGRQLCLLGNAAVPM